MPDTTDSDRCNALWARQLTGIKPLRWDDYSVEDGSDANVHHLLQVCDACYAVVPFYHFDEHAEWHLSVLASSGETQAVPTN